MEHDGIVALPASGTFAGRVWRPDLKGPSVVIVRDGTVIDITSRDTATLRDLLEIEDPAAYLRDVEGTSLGSLHELFANSIGEKAGADHPRLLAPCDLQAVKACGVTFAKSMVERVIEERAAGDPTRAEAVRAAVGAIIGDSLQNLVPGSAQAMQVKAALIEEGLWSQYLEVGIGRDAEVFTKSQPLSAVGWGADIGLHPVSTWNNPEPEVVLAVDSQGRIKGATLGNDVNLRDVEGRSALLLGKAKDNNASCAIGPFIRVFDETYGIDDLRVAELELTVEGQDGFRLRGESSMREISRDPLDLVAQTHGRHHQYPDGFMLFLGTLFAPTQDRDIAGEGFTHKIGDRVTISNDELGSLTNSVRLSTDCPEWTFGFSALMRNLSARNLI
ncbi:fumarylacetoacetate hydrolase family protein [Algihabitans albus]|uniref:fumarylacetoacetate hydrolase family protein n=1 Tax=Algihabitans albus TaxID=2164067 RepID=UPI000E5D7A3C|nr:fumarylacetoacetate hydrolase family protein [Algihabitans albus]